MSCKQFRWENLLRRFEQWNDIFQFSYATQAKSLLSSNKVPQLHWEIWMNGVENALKIWLPTWRCCWWLDRLETEERLTKVRGKKEIFHSWKNKITDKIHLGSPTSHHHHISALTIESQFSHLFFKKNYHFLWMWHLASYLIHRLTVECRGKIRDVIAR